MDSSLTTGRLPAAGRLLKPPDQEDDERKAFVTLEPAGFTIRHPPKPHLLRNFITQDDELFQTIHMGAAAVDHDAWRLVINGLVERPYSINLEILKSMPKKTITSFHECYGSPLKPATDALWRVGNVKWTGVPLKDILQLAQPLPNASYVWSEGLDRGEFGGIHADRYQKDLPIAKAMSEEVLLAYEINGKPLDRRRGGPVRLVVPGWFGTNSTKWISKITLQNCRASGPYTTTFYNEPDPAAPPGTTRPVWQVEVNSLIFRPQPDSLLEGPCVTVEGWAWHENPVKEVEISLDAGGQWMLASLDPRTEYSWQKFHAEVQLDPGHYKLLARARSSKDDVQPLTGRRNHCHSVEFEVV